MVLNFAFFFKSRKLVLAKINKKKVVGELKSFCDAVFENKTKFFGKSNQGRKLGKRATRFDKQYLCLCLASIDY